MDEITRKILKGILDILDQIIDSEDESLRERVFDLRIELPEPKEGE